MIRDIEVVVKQGQRVVATGLLSGDFTDSDVLQMESSANYVGVYRFHMNVRDSESVRAEQADGWTAHECVDGVVKALDASGK